MNNSKETHPHKSSINTINNSSGRLADGENFQSVDSSHHVQAHRKKAIDAGHAPKQSQDLKLQSQEKKAGDRQSVPNIDDSTPINV